MATSTNGAGASTRTTTDRASCRPSRSGRRCSGYRDHTVTPPSRRGRAVVRCGYTACNPSIARIGVSTVTTTSAPVASSSSVAASPSLADRMLADTISTVGPRGASRSMGVHGSTVPATQASARVAAATTVGAARPSTAGGCRRCTHTAATAPANPIIGSRTPTSSPTTGTRGDSRMLHGRRRARAVRTRPPHHTPWGRGESAGQAASPASQGPPKWAVIARSSRTSPGPDQASW